MNGALAAVALGALLASLVPVPVQANVIYFLAPTALTPREPSSVPSAGTREIGFDLELTDAASADGTFALSGPYNNPLSRILPRYDGDVREFVRFGVGTEAYPATPTQRAGSLDISLSFSASGDVTTGRIVTRGLTTALDLIITDDVVSGFVSGLSSEAGASFCGALPDARGCSVSGLLVRTSGSSGGPAGVPEPGSLALLGVGAFGLAVASRRRPGGGCRPASARRADEHAAAGSGTSPPPAGSRRRARRAPGRAVAGRPRRAGRFGLQTGAAGAKFEVRAESDERRGGKHVREG